jgi:hypothetical protein
LVNKNPLNPKVAENIPAEIRKKSFAFRFPTIVSSRYRFAVLKDENPF